MTSRMIRRALRESAMKRAGFYQTDAPVPEEMCFADFEELQERANKQMKHGVLRFLSAHTIRRG